ncbi:hypothetical protein O181_001806 [Austropuccinia psidii MF-1]|uniref:Uncharacterized protein n=1 Tax=Austropuccinia psidii MF-1 TaxID=1389203 RepID=A0A9Q3BAX9_9BASI|nr:hypothetical protein [Austropuccinia psidii MF-1]
MVNTPGLGGKNKLFPNGKILPGYLKWKTLFEETIINIERDIPMSFFLKQKDRLTSLHPDMPETMLNNRILRNCGGNLENSIRSRFIEPCSTEDYLNSMEDITTREKIGRNWYKPQIYNNTSWKHTSRQNKPQDRAPFKVHKCGSTTNLANTCPKNPRISEIEIGKAKDTKETNDVSLQESDSEPSEEEELPDHLSIEKIDFPFEVTEVHTHLPQYSDECMNLMHVQEAKMKKTKPAGGKGYTADTSCITNIVIKKRSKDKY